MKHSYVACHRGWRGIFVDDEEEPVLTETIYYSDRVNEDDLKVFEDGNQISPLRLFVSPVYLSTSLSISLPHQRILGKRNEKLTAFVCAYTSAKPGR